MADHLYALPSGYRLDAHEFKTVLDVGHYGIKYVGFDHHHDRPVAIKEYLPDSLAVRQEDTNVLPRSTADEATFDIGLSRFLDEAQMQSRLNEPNFVKIHQVLRANGTGYVVMDYVEGETLSQVLARRGTLSEEDMHAIVQPLLKPLELVHSMGFVHQDIRPGGIVLREDGSPVLLDLGIGRQTLGSARQTFGDRKQSINLSTPTAGFSALEMYSDHGRLGPWTDIYSLGAVMYNCLMGRPPSDAPSRAIDDELVATIDAAKLTCSEETLAAIQSALALPAGQRPPSIEAWRTKLPYGTADSEPQRPGHMARGSTRVAARGIDFASKSEKKASKAKSRRRLTWIFPTLAAAGLIIMLTYADKFLRSCEGADCNVAIAETPVSSIPVQTLPASLTVRTTPPKAEVFINDSLAGSTPLDLTDLSAGEYRLTLSHPLYDNMDVEEVLIGGKSTLVERTLVRATGALSIVSQPPGAWIEVGGDLKGTTPAILDNLEAGALTLTLGGQGYHTEKVATEVRKNSLVEVEVSLKSKIAYGTLTLALTPPDATVTLPDVVERYVPGMELPQGTYTVVVARQGYRSETRSVEIVGDKRVAIALTINPQPFTVATVPDGAAIRFPISGKAYSPGMLLPPGRHLVQALLIGYRTWEGTITHGTTPTQHEVTLEPGIAEFADRLNNGDAAPTMVLVESGQFRMGCLASAGCRDNEVPARTVNLPAPFALSKFEVTFNDYDRFTESTGRPKARNPRGWERGDWPVVNVSWQDATAYVEWLTAETGRTYRLPSEAEWEYAARAGTETAYSWGDTVGSALANCNGCGSLWDNVSPTAVGTFNANPWGLHDMHGNVWEWVQDCQLTNYRDAPNNAAAHEAGDCKRRMLRGGSYSNSPPLVRVSIREWDDVSLRVIDIGFRVAASAE